MTRQQEIQRLINEAYRIGGNTYGGAASAYDGGIDAFNALVRERDALSGQRYDMRNNRYVRTGAATPSANAIARAARIVENHQAARDTITVQQPRQQPSPAVRDSVTVRDSVDTVDSPATRRESAIDMALRLGTGAGTGQRGPTGRNSRSLRRTAEATVAPQRPAATQTQQPTVAAPTRSGPLVQEAGIEIWDPGYSKHEQWYTDTKRLYDDNVSQTGGSATDKLALFARASTLNDGDDWGRDGNDVWVRTTITANLGGSDRYIRYLSEATGIPASRIRKRQYTGDRRHQIGWIFSVTR